VRIQIAEKMLESYPKMTIGYLVAKVEIRKNDPLVEELKSTLQNTLLQKEINATNFVAHPSIAVWRRIYTDDFHVEPKTYRSSIESLLKRVLTGKGLWNIFNVVDLYNCCSVLSLLPMGGYDLRKIQGDLEIRYGKTEDTFQGIGMKEKIEVKKEHIIYADEKKVLCWLWNHKDAIDSCIDKNTQEVLFFIDSAVDSSNSVESALKLLSQYLEKIGATLKCQGILHASNPSTYIGA
jgi:DNA/RNA-binding domain of Phe-tRNA-synthetase-like protein